MIWNAKAGMLWTSPHQASGKKAVIEPLIGGQHRRIAGLRRRLAGPEKHFQDQEIDMQRRDERDEGIGDKDHGAFPQRDLRISGGR